MREQQEKGTTVKLAFVFPGQGSQKVGMLNGFEGNAAVEDVLARADAALGQKLSTLIAEGPESDLNLTVNTQPALLATSFAMFRAWREAGGAMPEVVAGHSLGEYTALAVAGSFSLEDGVRLVRFRAQAMQSAVPVGVGAMAAVLGLSDEAVAELCAKAVQPGEVLEPVNYNCPGQVVIAGHAASIARACELASEMGARRALTLPVSAPFHSSLLAGASRELAGELARTEVAAPMLEVIANVDVEVHTTPEEVRRRLAAQAASPVQWVGTVRKMQQMGVTHVVECGPGKVLTGMIRRICPELKTFNITDDDSLQVTLGALAQ